MAVLQVRAEWTGLGTTPHVNVFNFSDAATSPQEAADAVAAFFVPIMVRVANDYTVLVDPVVRTLDAATGVLEGIDGVTTAVDVGESSAAPLPDAVQGLVQWRTGIFTAGREVRGRTFIPGLTASDLLDGNPAVATLAALQAGADAMISAGGGDFCVWSRTGGALAPVSTGAPWGEFAVLRSRRD